MHGRGKSDSSSVPGKHRIADQRVQRHIKKWLNAGVRITQPYPGQRLAVITQGKSPVR